MPCNCVTLLFLFQFQIAAKALEDDGKQDMRKLTTQLDTAATSRRRGGRVDRRQQLLIDCVEFWDNTPRCVIDL